MARLWLFFAAVTLAAAQHTPTWLLWPQAGVLPPGTNNFPAPDPNATAGPQVNPAGVLGAPAVSTPVVPIGVPAAAPPPPGAQVGTPGGVPASPGAPPAPGGQVTGPGGIYVAPGAPVTLPGGGLLPPGVPNGRPMMVSPQQPARRPPPVTGTGPPSGGVIGIAPRPGEPSPSSPGNDGAPGSALLVSPSCSVIVDPGDVNVPAEGGTFEVRGVIRPFGCKPALVSSELWIAPVRNTAVPVFRFSVAANARNAPRLGVLLVGDQKVLVRQDQSRGPQFAAAPGSISFRSDGGRAPSARMLTILAEDKNLAYTVVSAQPWLKVTPRKGSGSAIRFSVSIVPDRLHSGRNEGTIIISASGSPEAPLRIPVTVEVPRLR